MAKNTILYQQDENGQWWTSTAYALGKHQPDGRCCVWKGTGATKLFLTESQQRQFAVLALAEEGGVPMGSTQVDWVYTYEVKPHIRGAAGAGGRMKKIFQQDKYDVWWWIWHGDRHRMRVSVRDGIWRSHLAESGVTPEEQGRLCVLKLAASGTFIEAVKGCRYDTPIPTFELDIFPTGKQTQ